MGHFFFCEYFEAITTSIFIMSLIFLFIHSFSKLRYPLKKNVSGFFFFDKFWVDKFWPDKFEIWPFYDPFVRFYWPRLPNESDYLLSKKMTQNTFCQKKWPRIPFAKKNDPGYRFLKIMSQVTISSHFAFFWVIRPFGFFCESGDRKSKLMSRMTFLNFSWVGWPFSENNEL